MNLSLAPSPCSRSRPASRGSPRPSPPPEPRAGSATRVSLRCSTSRTPSELAYVVLEWVAGESLLDMLADGPLDAPNAVSLLCEAALAIAAAHAGGLAHLRLNPACLHWTRGSGVKITGLGIDAVLAGLPPVAAENGQSAGDGPEDGPEDWTGPRAHRHPGPGPAAVRRADRLLARLAGTGRAGRRRGADRPARAPIPRAPIPRAGPGCPRRRRRTGCRAPRARCPRPSRPTSTP